jgi:hypothetical protein
MPLKLPISKLAMANQKHVSITHNLTKYALLQDHESFLVEAKIIANFEIWRGGGELAKQNLTG